MAMAMRDSVTVSMADEISGVLSAIPLVNWVCVLTCDRHHLTVGGHQQDVVEGQCFRKIFGQHNV